MKNNRKNHVNRRRRTFLQMCAIAGSGLAVGVPLRSCRNNRPETQPITSPGNNEKVAISGWISIGADNRITIMVNQSEMGQGIATALCMIVAEELEADWSQIRFEMAPVAEIYKHPDFGIQWTVSSKSISGSWNVWRKAGAVVRELLIAAAARIWAVAPGDCQARNSEVVFSPTGKRLPYGELVFKTAGLKPVDEPKLKEPQQFKLIGRSLHRLDGPAKIDGSAVFGIDVRLPDMLTATVLHPPGPGFSLQSYDEKAARTIPGTRGVYIITGGIAVVADTFWQAQTAMAALSVRWQRPQQPVVVTDQLFDHWSKLGGKPGKVVYEHGSVDILMRHTTGRFLEARYDLPYQAHATPEPMNCTARVTAEGCEIWVPTQNPDSARQLAATITGLDTDRVQVHTTFMGGGFGRRAMVDYVGEAVELSIQAKAPVKVIWTREEDIGHDFYRTASHNFLQAVIDERGRPLAWLHRIVGGDVFTWGLPHIIPALMPDGPNWTKKMAGTLAENLLPRWIAGKKAVLGAGPLPYAIPAMRIEFIHDDPGIPLCWWRSVAHSSNCFAVESFLDEVATAAGRDPVDLRLELLTPTPRLRHVVELAAASAAWSSPPQAGIHRGIAAHDFQETMMAVVAEVSVEDRSRIRVHRLVCAVDCGIAVNPRNIEAQVQSALVFGLTATLKSSITFVDGCAEQRNFDTFPLLRMNEMPKIETHIVPSTRPPSGIGEAAVPLAGPAIANALFAATGKRVRRLHIRPSDIR